MIDERVLIEQIDDFTKVVKEPSSDYLKGYVNALAAVKGMITAQLLKQKVGGANGRAEDTKER